MPHLFTPDYTPVGILCPGGHSENRAMPHWCWVSDYYPFGFEKPATSWIADSMGYRYAFNGKENDPTGMGGGGSTYDYGFRIYNAQIARFLSVDPLTKGYPMLTPYQFASNTPIQATDLDGLEADFVILQNKDKDGYTVVEIVFNIKIVRDANEASKLAFATDVTAGLVNTFTQTYEEGIDGFTEGKTRTIATINVEYVDKVKRDEVALLPIGIYYKQVNEILDNPVDQNEVKGVPGYLEGGGTTQNAFIQLKEQGEVMNFGGKYGEHPISQQLQQKIAGHEMAETGCLRHRQQLVGNVMRTFDPNDTGTDMTSKQMSKFLNQIDKDKKAGDKQ